MLLAAVSAGALVALQEGPQPEGEAGLDAATRSAFRRQALAAVLKGKQVEARVVNVEEGSGRVVLSGECPPGCRLCFAAPGLLPALRSKDGVCRTAQAEPLFVPNTHPPQSVRPCKGDRTRRVRSPPRSSCRRLQSCWGRRLMPEVRSWGARPYGQRGALARPGWPRLRAPATSRCCAARPGTLHPLLHLPPPVTLCCTDPSPSPCCLQCWR